MNSAFAAGFFGRAADIMTEKRLAKREREERMEVIMEQRRTNLFKLAADRAARGGGTGKSGGSGPSSAKEIEAYGQFLVGKGVEKDTVARLMATNDSKGLGELVDNIRKAEATYKTAAEDFTPELINDVINNTVSVNSETYTLEMGDFLTSLGLNPEDYNYTPEELAAAGLGEEKTVPGKIVPAVVPEPREKISTSARKDIIEQIREPSLDMARKEFAGYKRMINDLAEGGPLYEDLGGDPETVNYFRGLAAERVSTLSTVFDQVKEGSYTGLLDMYGQNAFEALDKYYKLTEMGVPIPYLGDGSSILQLPSGQEEYFDHVLGQYGVTNYKYYTPE